MEAAKNFNVYNKISRGEHICKGDKLYSREEIKKMLNDSGLSAEEIKMLYELNAEAAFEEVSKMAGDKFVTLDHEERFKLEEGGTTFRLVSELEKTWLIQVVAFWIQIIMGIVAAVVIHIEYPDSLWLVVPLFLLGMSYLLATLFADMFKSIYEDRAKSKVFVPESYGNDKMGDLLIDRQKVMNSICNTLHMYEVMGDFIKSTPTHHLGDDDLK